VYEDVYSKVTVRVCLCSQEDSAIVLFVNLFWEMFWLPHVVCEPIIGSVVATTLFM
jgi:hypothetical protein